MCLLSQLRLFYYDVLYFFFFKPKTAYDWRISYWSSDLCSSDLGAPGTHGDVVAGMQGIGVSTPIAAEVAEATVGFASEVHMPNGMMFSIGTWSMIVAAGWLLDRVRLTGSTTSDDG